VIHINVSRRRLRIPQSPQNLINESPEFSLAGTSPYLKFRMTALQRIINGTVELPVFRAILRRLPATRFIRRVARHIYIFRVFCSTETVEGARERGRERERKRFEREKDKTCVSSRVDYNSIDVRTK